MYEFRMATLDDIQQLVQYRLSLLRSAIGDGEAEKWPLVEEQISKYYREAIADGSHVAYLVFCGDQCVGTGGVCFYRILPTYYKPTGKKAYIINMYTEPAYRRRGIAMQLLDLLVHEALSRGATYISLEATDMGRPLYEKYGFATLRSEMQFMNETYEGDVPD